MRASVFDGLDVRRAYEIVTGCVVNGRTHSGGRYVTVTCPVATHLDNRPSCDLDLEKNLWRCFSGEHHGKIVDLPIVAGLVHDEAGAGAWYAEKTGFQSDGERLKPFEAEAHTKATVAGLASARKLDERFLRRMGLEDTDRGVRYALRDVKGEIVSHRVRAYLETAHPTHWDGPTVAYLPDDPPKILERPRERGMIVFCEGETDALTLWSHGIAAIGIPGNSMTKLVLPAHVGTDTTSVATGYVIREPKGGKEFVEGVVDRAKELGFQGEIKVVDLHAKYGVKDPSELHVRDPHTFDEKWNAALAAAKPYAAEEPSKKCSWVLRSASEIATRTIPPAAWDVDTLLPADDGPTLFFGPPGALKSWLTIHLCLCLAMQSNFLGKFPVRKPREVIYVNFDAGENPTMRRIQRLVTAKSAPPNFHLVSPEVFDPVEMALLFAEHPGAFIAIDCLADFFHPDRSKEQSEAMRGFVRGLRGLYAKHRCNGVVLDHPHRPRDGQPGDYYGSIQKEASCRTMWVATPIEGDDKTVRDVKITCRKMNEAEPFAPFLARVTFSADAITYTYEGELASAGPPINATPNCERIENLLADVPHPGMKARAIAAIPGWTKDKVLAEIKNSKKIASLGSARNRTYLVPESSSSHDDSPDDSPDEASAPQNHRKESSESSETLRVFDDSIDSLEAADNRESTRAADDSPDDSPDTEFDAYFEV